MQKKTDSNKYDVDGILDEFELDGDLRQQTEVKLAPESLIGKCLVHIGSSSKEIYNQAVIYITEATPEIVRGIVVNKLLFGSAMIECKNPVKDSVQNGIVQGIYEDLYQGGPENPAHGFVLFPREDYLAGDPYAQVQGDIAISSSFGVLQEILDGQGPQKKIIAMGHCVWHRGELEWEIFNNQWLIIPSNVELLFNTKFEDRWEKAKLDSGLNLGTYVSQIGMA